MDYLECIRVGKAGSRVKFIDLYTPSGIGDIYWVLMKLARKANEVGAKFRIHTPPGADIKMARGKFLEFIDCVESVTPDGIPYPALIKKAREIGFYTELQPVMYCECNTWLEEGNRIEHYLPAFETEFVLNWQVDHDSLRKAKRYLRADKKNVVIYTSSIANNESTSTGSWKASDWSSRISELAKMPDVNLIWIGASYDEDMLKQWMDIRFAASHVLIDEPADVIVMLLRMCDGFISYQSGLSVISVIESVPTFMLYFRKIDKLRFAFNPPGGNYDAPFFDHRPDFSGWVQELPMRPILGRGKKLSDYTFWVNDNVEQTEKDWLENPTGHREQYETIADLEGAITEVGCGSGQLATYIKNPYQGMDQSIELLKIAQHKNPSKAFALVNIRKLDVARCKVDNVCAFGFMKHFSLAEWDSIFARLATMAVKTLTVETPLAETDWEEMGYDFPHVFVTDTRVRANATRNGFKVVRVTENSAKEFTYRMERVR
jgi:hypothetical protein